MKLLQHRFDREHRPGVLSDIYGEAVYRSNAEFFQHKCNVSFCLNYDGAPVFKYSSMQIWLAQLYLNELPPCIRKVTNSSYVLVCLVMFVLSL